MPPPPLPAQPTLILLAGANGAGKSTLHRLVLGPRTRLPFVNADAIQRDELRDPDPSASYQAARLAAERRAAHLAAGESFVTETVFSHPSKLELLRDARTRGYRLIVLHIGVERLDTNLSRVARRVRRGGHGVPEHKVGTRRDRGGALIREAVLMADRAGVFDNSAEGRPPTRHLWFRGGVETRRLAPLPDWIAALYDRPR